MLCNMVTCKANCLLYLGAQGVTEGGKMSSNDQYCLRWNSYETNILATFEGLLDSEALSDVTLFCEGEIFRNEIRKCY